MNIVIKKLAELRHPKQNVRMHPDKQIAELKRSLAKNGQTRLLVVDEEGVIWIGNGLFIAMQEMGYTEAYCIVKEGMSENDKKKLMMSDNRIFDLGVDDMKAFDQILLELGDDLDIPGYDDSLLETLTTDLQGVDKILSTYGVVDEERKEEIREAREKYIKNDESPACKGKDYSPQIDARSEEQAIEEKCLENERSGLKKEPFILCPKCGEKIWL